MNGTEIFSTLHKNSITKKYFVNVFAHDQLPSKIQKRKWFLVSNCCPANMPGLHWFAMFKENGVMELFDSYGGDPYTYDLTTFLQNQDVDKCVYNSVRLQALDSNVCAHYCIFYAYWRCKGLSMKTILDWFSEHDFIENDKFVKNFYDIILK